MGLLSLLFVPPTERHWIGDLHEKIYIIYYIMHNVINRCSSRSDEILEGYSNCEEYYSEGFQDYIDYCKYFYSEDDDNKFEESDYYQL